MVRILALAASSALFLAPLLAAQDKPDRPPWAQPGATSPPPASPPPTEQPPQKETTPAPVSPRGTIKVNVSLVNVLVSVLDDHNRPAPNLPIEAFQLFEEGVPQKIDIFESETKQPLDLALMIDASLSAHKEIAFEQDAATHFIRQILRP